MKTIVQISLDLINIPEALQTAQLAIRAGVDWLEAGTPLIIAEGMNGVRALREAFPQTPIVADLKTMDGGWLEAEIMAKAGATHVVVMERAHPETIKMVVKAGKDFGLKVMGDNLAAGDMVAAAKRLERPCEEPVRLRGRIRTRLPSPRSAPPRTSLLRTPSRPGRRRRPRPCPG